MYGVVARRSQMQDCCKRQGCFEEGSMHNLSAEIPTLCLYLLVGLCNTQEGRDRLLAEIEGDVAAAALAFERTLEEDNWPLELPSAPPLNKS